MLATRFKFYCFPPKFKGKLFIEAFEVPFLDDPCICQDEEVVRVHCTECNSRNSLMIVAFKEQAEFSVIKLVIELYFINGSASSTNEYFFPV